ncbi:MAG: preprotein translocase subunit YajC [Silvanigrellaceae bacterium]|nr:preprotein translocase subunit YajC [Silvanigrellaceae bacterium]
MSKLIHFGTSSLCALGILSFSSAYGQEASAPIAVPGNVASSGASAPPQWINFVFIGGIILFMWLFVIRPQSKRAKEQKLFLESLASGMEVVTTGGIVGKITQVTDTMVSLDVGCGTIRIVKSAVSHKLGTN